MNTRTKGIIPKKKTTRQKPTKTVTVISLQQANLKLQKQVVLLQQKILKLDKQNFNQKQKILKLQAANTKPKEKFNLANIEQVGIRVAEIRAMEHNEPPKK